MKKEILRDFFNFWRNFSEGHRWNDIVQEEVPMENIGTWLILLSYGMTQLLGKMRQALPHIYDVASFCGFPKNLFDCYLVYMYAYEDFADSVKIKEEDKCLPAGLLHDRLLFLSEEYEENFEQYLDRFCTFRNYYEEFQYLKGLYMKLREGKETSTPTLQSSPIKSTEKKIEVKTSLKTARCTKKSNTKVKKVSIVPSQPHMRPMKVLKKTKNH